MSCNVRKVEYLVIVEYAVIVGASNHLKPSTNLFFSYTNQYQSVCRIKFENVTAYNYWLPPFCLITFSNVYNKPFTPPPDSGTFSIAISKSLDGVKIFVICDPNIFTQASGLYCVDIGEKWG